MLIVPFNLSFILSYLKKYHEITVFSVLVLSGFGGHFTEYCDLEGYHIP